MGPTDQPKDIHMSGKAFELGDLSFWFFFFLHLGFI